MNERAESNGTMVDDVVDLNQRLNELPLEQQDLISSFSSFFLEPDVKQRYGEDPRLLETLKEQLGDLGLKPDSINLALQVFGLSDQDHQIPETP